jgi:hypothetical protein
MKNYELFTADAKEKFLAALASKEVEDLIAKTKAADDSGSFEGIVISTEHQDRMGEVVMQDGMDTGLYMKNPVVLNSHNYSGIENIIGTTTKLYPGVVDGAKATLADGKWAPTEQGQLARTLWEGGFLRAASIGFIAEEFDPNQQNIISKSQLLEYSPVPVPANGYATRLSALGLTVEGLRAKGFAIPEEEAEEEKKEEKAAPPQEGDMCVLDDGSEGVMQNDGNGALVCMPKPKSAEPPKEETEEKGVKAGRTLSENTKAAINKAIDASKACTAALEELLSAAEPQGGEGKEQTRDGDAPKSRSKEIAESLFAGFDGWQKKREVLRFFVTEGSKVLAEMNVEAQGRARRN